MSARSSVYEDKILLTKSFQASQSWHQLSVYENKIFVQNCLQNGKVVTSFTNGPLIVTISTKAMKQSQGAATNLVIWWDEKANKKLCILFPTSILPSDLWRTHQTSSPVHNGIDVLFFDREFGMWCNPHGIFFSHHLSQMIFKLKICEGNRVAWTVNETHQ